MHGRAKIGQNSSFDNFTKRYPLDSNETCFKLILTNERMKNIWQKIQWGRICPRHNLGTNGPIYMIRSPHGSPRTPMILFAWLLYQLMRYKSYKLIPLRPISALSRSYPRGSWNLKKTHGARILFEIYVDDHWADFQDSEAISNPRFRETSYADSSVF